MAVTSPLTHMKGVIIESTGGVEVLQYKTDLPVPVPKEGEVLIKNNYIGVNFIDINFRIGLYPSSKPHILGCEGEGTIVSISSKEEASSGLKLGDCVVWLNSANGGYAEYSVCPASKVYVLPPDLEPGIAAVSFSQGLTALAFIKNSYCVQKADWILVQGAAGGVGIWLCRLLKWVGAKVIAIVSSVEKVQLVAENGANFVLSSKDDDIVTRVLEITEGKGVAAVFDGVGKVTFDMGLQVLARDGTMVTYGNASGNVTGFDVDRLKEKNLRLMRPRVFGYIQTREEFVGFAERLFSYIRGTEGIGVAGGVYPLEEVARAHNDLEGRKAVGKLILKL